MNTTSVTSFQLTKLFLKSISVNYMIWSEELYFYLKDFGVREKLCRRIARSRAMFAVGKLEHKRIDVFGHIQGIEHAFALYCAYIRHEKTRYDDFCAEVSKELCEGPLEKDVLRSLWKMRCPTDYELYKNKCASLRNALLQKYDSEFTY